MNLASYLEQLKAVIGDGETIKALQAEVAQLQADLSTAKASLTQAIQEKQDAEASYKTAVGERDAARDELSNYKEGEEARRKTPRPHEAEDRRARRQGRGGRRTAVAAGAAARAGVLGRAARGAAAVAGPLALFGLGATYGPAVLEAVRGAIDEAQEGASVAVKAKLEALDQTVAALEHVIGAVGEGLERMQQTFTTVFGAAHDVAQLAKWRFLFNPDNGIDAEELATWFNAHREIRKDLAMGRWAEREVMRRLIGHGLGHTIGEAFKSQE